MNDPGTTFEAGAFHPSLGNEVAAGRISIDRWNFHFQSEAVNIEIPLSRLHARLGEGDDDKVYFCDASAPGWEIFTVDGAVLEHPYLRSVNNVRNQLTNVAAKRELWRRVRLLGYVVGICVLLVWVGQVAVSAMVRSLVSRLPPEVEAQIGADILADVKSEMEFSTDTNRVAKLAALAAPLVNSIGDEKTKFTFYIAELDDPNAFALPGGHVIVTSGLLKMADRPEEVLGVIAHEVAHVTQKHGVRKAISSVGPFLIFQVFLGGNSRGLARVAGSASDLLIQQSFSQEYEIEADDVGWQTLVAAKIDPRGMTEMFEKFKGYEKRRRTGFELPQAFQSHPALEKRIAALEKKWRKLPKNIKFMDLSEELPLLKSAADR